jgi:hypothetical protein
MAVARVWVLRRVQDPPLRSDPGGVVAAAGVSGVHAHEGISSAGMMTKGRHHVVVFVFEDVAVVHVAAGEGS